MIIDSCKNITTYAALLPFLENGLAACENASELEVGRYDFEGGYFMIQQGSTTPLSEGTFEAHRDYIDVQILLDGAEEIAWLEYTDATTAAPYDEASDKERLDGPRDHHILISKGMFWVAFPNDAHKAVAHSDQPHDYRKIVMKLPVNR